MTSEQELAKHYQELGSLRADFRNSNLVSLLLRWTPGKTIVDVGCGNGFFASSLVQTGKTVIGIESNESMRALAAMYNPEVSIIAGDAGEVHELIREPVDTVVMVDVLEHIEDDVEQVKKVASILKSSGSFVIVVPSHQFLYGERDSAVGHYRRYSKKQLVTLLEENGFSVQRARFWNMLGVLPYWISEKILHKPLSPSIRNNEQKSFLSQCLHKVLFMWFQYIENKCNFGFGLSLLVEARKKI